MGTTRSEDTIFVVDASRSMFRMDIAERSRYRNGIIALKKIIEIKKKEDKTDRFSVVAFNGMVYSPNEMFYDSKDILKFLAENAEFQHGTSYGEAIAAALRIIIEELRKIGEKTLRIIIISDGLGMESKLNPLTVAKTAKELGVIIDVIRFGPPKVPGNLLKRITEVTSGDYYFISSEAEFFEVIQKISKKKESAIPTIFDKNKNKDNLSSELLAEIAGDLLKLDELTAEQKFKVMKVASNQKIKCSICYSTTCPTCGSDFYGDGRFCPNCLTPFHLHCAMAWADNQSKKDGYVSENYKIFRCVHCFYLLRIPLQNINTTIIENGGTGNKTVNKIKIENAPKEILTTICAHPDCGVMFDPSEDEYVYYCNNCQSYFHEDCFDEYYVKEHRCPQCKKIVEKV
ncbi:MAG: VWA domain-containing protein [Promethearchaeota archaeon]